MMTEFKLTHTAPPRLKMPDVKDYMTPQEAADELGFNLNSIYRMIDSGKLQGLRIGKKQRLVLRLSVADYKKLRKGKSKHDPNL